MTAAAVHAEGADAGMAHAFGTVTQPVTRTVRQIERSATGEFCQRQFARAGGRNDLLVEREAAAYQGGKPRSGPAVADVRLDAGDGAAPVPRAVAASMVGGHGSVGGQLLCRTFGGRSLTGGGRICVTCGRSEEVSQSSSFHAILGRAAAAVGFQITDLRRCQVRLAVGTLQGAAISGTSGDHQVAAGGADSHDHRIDPVAVAFGIFQPLQDHGGRTFADDAAVGGLVEGGGLTRTGERASQVLTESGAQVAGKIDRPDYGPIYLVSLKLAHGRFQRAQAGSLLAGQGEARPAATKLPGDTAGDHAAQRTHGPVGRERRSAGVSQRGGPVSQFLRAQVETQLLRPACRLFGDRPAEAEVGAVQVECDADKNAGTMVVGTIESCVGHGRSRRLQHQQLLGKHLLQLARRDAEQVGSQSELVQIVAGKGCSFESFLAKPGALFGSPPILRCGGLGRGVAPQHPRLEGGERLPGAETSVHADYGNGTFGSRTF